MDFEVSALESMTRIPDRMEDRCMASLPEEMPLAEKYMGADNAINRELRGNGTAGNSRTEREISLRNFINY